MFKAVSLVCFCVLNLSLSRLTDAKPIAGLQPTENPKVTTIQIPSAVISREELVALAQYIMRMMASRINITLQATASHPDFPRYADNVQVYSGAVQPTVPSAIPSNYYETLEDTKQTDQRPQNPCRKVEGTETGTEHSTDSGKTFTDSSVRSAYEPFVRFAERNVEQFPNQFGFEIIPNSEISTTYVPQVEKSGVSPPVQKVLNRQPLPSTTPVTSAAEERELRPGNIRLRNLTIERVPSSQPGNAVMSVPFEAIITFTRQKPSSPKLEVEDQNVVIPTRDPPDDFPPYFETVLPVGRKTSDPGSSPLDLNPEKIQSPAPDAANEAVVEDKHEVVKPMKKRQTPKVGELLEMLGLSTKRSKPSRRGGATGPTQSSLVVEPQTNIKVEKFSNVLLKEATKTPPKKSPMFQRQEIEDDEDDEDDEGSLGSIQDLLPLVVPILEDLSDPNTETDIAELLQAGLPLVQGISQGDGETEGVDLVGLVSPVISSLSRPNSNGTGTVFQAILPLILPFITPFIGPIIGPIIQGSSNPADQGGSSITPLIQALAGPLSLPAEPGGIPIASSLISGIIASLSRDLKAGGNGGSDIGALVSTLVSGVLAGGSAGIKAKFSKPPPPAAAHPGYGAYGQGQVPASSVDTLDLVGTSIKDILGLSLQLIKSVISSVTGILGASSAEQPRPVYGPANANFRVT